MKKIKTTAQKILPYLKRKISYATPDYVKFHLGIPTPIVNEDRDFLEKKIFSYVNSIAGANDKLLDMGVGIYTWHYYKQLKYEVYTIDFDEKRATYGNKGKHIIGSVMDLDKYYKKDFFKVIICNGLIGYGVDNPQDLATMLEKCYDCMTKDSILIIGYNNFRTLSYKVTDAPNYNIFEEYVPDIAGITAPSTEVSTRNNHTFLFLKKR